MASKKKTSPQKLLPPPSEQLLLTLDAFGNDQELLFLYKEWIDCGFNAGQAYQNLHPDVTIESARTLAWRKLIKVDKKILMQAYGLDMAAYLQQLKDGLSAEKKMILRKYDKNGGLVQEIDMSGPDHKTRDSYHDKLGVHLGIQDKKGDANSTEVKVLVIPSSGLADKYGIQISSDPGHSSER
jgi:hypothetical protein